MNPAINLSLPILAEANSGASSSVSMILSALFAFGAFHCWTISRRPTTNTKCALSLMCVLLLFCITQGIQMMRAAGLANGALAVVAVAVSLLALGVLGSGFVLAIIGLVEYAQDRERYNQGRSQAIWALVLYGIIGIIVLGAVVRQAGRMNAFTANSKAGEPLTNVARNYYFKAPPRGWVNFDMSKINKAAQGGFIHRYPDGYLMVIGEAMEDGEDMDTEQLVELGKAQMESLALELKEISHKPYVVNGLSGILAGYEARLSAGRIYYLRWTCSTNGWAYQLIGWGNLTERSRIDPELRQVIDCFAQLDPERKVQTRFQFETDYVSSRFNYGVKIATPGWNRYASLSKHFAEADFGAVHKDGPAFAVVPVWIGDEELSEDALTASLLSTLSIDYPDPGLINPRPITNGALHGMEYGFARKTSGDVTYRLRCLQGNGFAYLIAAWADSSDTNAEPVFDDAMSRVSFTTPLLSMKPDLAGYSSTELKTRAEVLNKAGLYYFDLHDYAKAAALFAEAARSLPNKPVYTLNAARAWSHRDRPKEALAYVEAQTELLKANPELRSYQAYFQKEAGLTEQALTSYAELFASGYRDDYDFTDYVNLLLRERRYPVATEEVERYLKVKDSVSIRLLEADIYSAQQDYPKAIALLTEQRDKAPFNAQVANALAEALLDADRFHDALEVCTKTVKLNKDASHPQFLKGRSELGLKWYREAKASFETALKLAPADENIRGYLDLVTSMLGEGSNTMLKEPITPVALPDSLTNSSITTLPAGYASDFGAYYSRRISAIHYEPGKDSRTTEYLSAQILDASGVESFSTVQMEFSPLSEQIFVNELRVFDAAGSLISTGHVSDYYVLDDSSDEVATHRKVLNIPIPGLSPGYRLQLTVTRRDLGRLEDFPKFQYCFSRTLPVHESVLFVSGEIGQFRFAAAPSVEEKLLPEGHLWRVLDPSVRRLEPMQPPPDTFLPMLRVSRKDASWTTLATNYLALIRDRLEPDPTVQRQALAMVAGLTNEQERIDAIVRHVQTNYTYKAIEFGPRARIPNKPADIVRNKYGDCKDHALLLKLMLDAVGVPARLVLAAQDSQVEKDSPSLDQFNHMLVYLPGVTGGRFLDCTDKGADVGHVIPYDLSGRDALVLDDLQSRFVTVPEYPLNASTIEVKRKIQFATPAEATVEETLMLSGIHAAFMRSFLLQTAPAHRRIALEKWFARDDRELTGLHLAGLEERDAPLNISITYPLQRNFRPDGDNFVGSLRAGMERVYFHTEPAAKRHSPFEIRAPLSFQAAVDVVPPPGFTAGLLPAPAQSVDARFGACTTSNRADQNTLHLEVTGHKNTGNFSAAEYSAYRESMSKVLSMLEREVILRPIKKGGG